MNYHIARHTYEGLVSIREFPTYSEADEWIDHYSDIYDNSVVDIFSHADFIEGAAPTN